MIQIVLIEDSAQDSLAISRLLDSCRAAFPHELHSFSSLAEGFSHLKQHRPDLLLLDLEFTYHNITAIPYLDLLPQSLPVIVVSHLSHFQLPLAHKANIRGFVHKSKLDSELFPAIQKVCGSADVVRPVAHHVKFPPMNPLKDLGVEINVNHIRYIDFFTRNTYHVHLTKGDMAVIKSVPLKEFTQALLDQGIDQLCRISRNQIINTHYISSIEKIDHSRFSLKLVNLPAPFIIGKQYEDSIRHLLKDTE